MNQLAPGASEDTVPFNARIPKTVHDDLRELATAEERSMNWLLGKLLREAIDARRATRQVAAA